MAMTFSFGFRDTLICGPTSLGGISGAPCLTVTARVALWRRPSCLEHPAECFLRVTLNLLASPENRSAVADCLSGDEKRVVWDSPVQLEHYPTLTREGTSRQ